MDFVAVEESMLGGLVSRRGDVVIARGEGCWLFDVDGRRYLDLGSAQGVAMLGHCHPAIVAAITAQAQTLISCPGFLYNETRARFADSLHALLPRHLAHAFVSNSGAEAMDAALKFARVATGRTQFIAASKGFHGRTVGALSVTWEPAYRKPFLPLLETTHVPYNNLEKLDAALTEQTAAVVLEVIQGEGGVNVGAPEFLRGAQQLCRERGALLIVDEIQTGFGRTGTLFASDALGLEPDIMTLAKGLGGGFPMGVTAYTERVRSALQPGMHGSTFGGNPLACAAGLAALHVYRTTDVIESSAALGEWMIAALRRRLDGREIVREVRGRAMMMAVELRERVAPFLKTLMTDHSIIALPGGPNVLRLLPPLILSREQAELAVDAIAEALPA